MHTIALARVREGDVSTRDERLLLSGLQLAGWALALVLLVGAGAGVFITKAHFAAQSRDETSRWTMEVEKIRACRRARPAPLTDWRDCEEKILAATWRKTLTWTAR